MSNEEGNRTRMTQIKRINTDQISEDQSNPRHQRSIPKNWSWVKLGDVCEILDNKRSPINSDERDKRISGKSIESLFPYYGATGQVGYIDDYLLEGEFVLLGEDGAPFLEKHKPKAYIVNGKIWVNNHAHILLSKNHNKFLCYYLNFLDYHPFVTGTTRLKLNQSAMKQIPIVNPPLPEQKKIVEKIEELFSGLDSGVASLKKAKEQIRLYRQSVLASAFSGKLVQEVGGRQSAIGKTEMLKAAEPKVEYSNQLPDGWKWVKLGEVCDKIQDGSHFSPQIQHSQKSDGKFLYITSKNIRNNYLDLNNITYVDKDFHNSIFQRCNPEFGDVLLTKDGANTGNVTINTLKEEFSLLSSVCLIKPNKQKIISHFIKYYLQSPSGFKAVTGAMTGTAIKRIILRTIKDADIILPPLILQTQIVEEIEKRFSEADNLEKAIDDSLAKSETLRQSILKQAFSGKLKMNN